VAFRIAQNAAEIRRRLASERRHYFSLRKTAQLLAVSTQPVRDWIRFGYLKQEGPRGQVAKVELERFLDWLCQSAEPFDTDRLTARFTRKLGCSPYLFQTLANSQFLWPRGRKALTPRELAELVGCHPSLITKAIHKHGFWRLGRRKTPHRWEIGRRAWQNTFLHSRIANPNPRLPSLPRRPQFSICEAAGFLRLWGMLDASPYRVRRMISEGELEALRLLPFRRKWFVTRKSLEKMRKKLLTAS
jgi:hypothetical protein